MTLSTITVKAPGSMMLMGEHAVLHQEPAIVAAIDRWITVTLSPRNDEKLSIESVFGSLTQPIHQKPSAPWADWIFFLIRLLNFYFLYILLNKFSFKMFFL